MQFIINILIQPNVKAIYNRFLDTANGYEIFGENGLVNAKYNWWGSNNTPSGKIYNSVDFNQWIQDVTGSPRLVSSSPVNAATKVSGSKTIIITFNEYVKKGTNFFVELKDSTGKLIPINVSLSGKILKIDPLVNLPEFKYTIIIHSGALTDYVDNGLPGQTIKFSVGNSPILTYSNPVNVATNVARNITIKIIFNEAIQAGNNFWIELKTITGISLWIKKTIYCKVLTITHPTILSRNTTYKLILHSGCVIDLAGNPSTSKTIYFTTRKT